MKKGLFVVAVFLSIAGAAFAADPVVGYWKSVDEVTGEATAFWNIYEKGGQLFGEMVKIIGKPDDTLADNAKSSYKGFPRSGDVSKMKVIGTPWIYGLKKNRPGEWSSGYIVNPEDGKFYQCKIMFRAADNRKYPTDCLEMRGEIGFGIGRSQYWLKASPSEY